MFQIEFSKQASSFLKQTDIHVRKRMFSKIDFLKEQPVLHDTKSVIGFKEKLFRIRVGDYRILYTIYYVEQKIIIVKIDTRSNAY